MNNSRRYYAVRIGREGSRIYDSYTEVRSLFSTSRVETLFGNR